MLRLWSRRVMPNMMSGVGSIQVLRLWSRRVMPSMMSGVGSRCYVCGHVG